MKGYLADKPELVEFIQGIPKVELHLHIEGTLEPELLFRLAEKHGVELPYENIEAVRKAYQFHNLQSFLDIYYQGCDVLRDEDDFYQLTIAYLRRVAEDNVIHTEIFFDPQSHTDRGVPMATVLAGIQRALREAAESFGISARLILCFLRHLSEEAAFATLEQVLPHIDEITAVGLDSSELGHPPEKFERVFAKAQAQGLITVAHAGEEGPPEYIWGALDRLNVSRIDHGVRCLEDEALVKRLHDGCIPLTVCPLSNIKLAVFSKMRKHNLKDLLAENLLVTINSDDPAYFGGYMTDNYLAVSDALKLDKDVIITLCRNSITASFLAESEKAKLYEKLENYIEAHPLSAS